MPTLSAQYLYIICHFWERHLSKHEIKKYTFIIIRKAYYLTFKEVTTNGAFSH